MDACFTTYELRRHGLMLGFDVVDVSNTVPKPLNYCTEHATSFEIFAAISFGFGSDSGSRDLCATLHECYQVDVDVVVISLVLVVIIHESGAVGLRVSHVSRLGYTLGLCKKRGFFSLRYHKNVGGSFFFL